MFSPFHYMFANPAKFMSGKEKKNLVSVDTLRGTKPS